MYPASIGGGVLSLWSCVLMLRSIWQTACLVPMLLWIRDKTGYPVVPEGSD